MELIKTYLSQNHVKTLSKEETYELVTKAQAGCRESHDKLIIHNLPYVIKIAYKYSWRADSVSDFNDLFQEGVIGLIRSLKTFDIKRDMALTTYADMWIKQVIGRYIDNNRGPVRVPIYLQTLKRKYAKLKKEDESHSDEFYVRLLAAQNEQSVANLRYDISHAPSDIRIDREYEDSGETFQLESIIDEHEIDIDLLDAQALLEKLSDDEQYILERRMIGWTFDKISKERGLSRERIRQIEELALFKMQSMITTVKDGDVFKTREKLWGEYISTKKEIDMKIDTGTMNSHIYGVCSDCVNKALTLSENKSKSQLGIPNWVDAECDICHRIKPCAKPEIYGFPVFKVKV